jgi:hypothetical protein
MTQFSEYAPPPLPHAAAAAAAAANGRSMGRRNNHEISLRTGRSVTLNGNRHDEINAALCLSQKKHTTVTAGSHHPVEIDAAFFRTQRAPTSRLRVLHAEGEVGLE